MRRRTVVEGPKAAQKLKLLLANRTFREEFYACRDLIADSIVAMRFELRKAVEKYNKFRPHHALKGRTPMEYLRINQADAA
jgi:putative transposase